MNAFFASGVLLITSAVVVRGEQLTYFEGPRTSALQFKVTSEGKSVIAATVSGHPTFLFIDTGSTTILDIAYAREIGLTPVETADFGTGLTGVAGKRWIAYADFEIGRMKISHYPVSCLDLSGLRALHKKNELPDLVGLVGSDLLVWLRAEIDYHKLLLKIRRPTKAPNQSPEPTAMSVTPPAAQESRQP